MVFALLRLLPVIDQAKEVEILALRRQIMVLERQLGKARPRFSLADRAFLAPSCDLVALRAANAPPGGGVYVRGRL